MFEGGVCGIIASRSALRLLLRDVFLLFLLLALFFDVLPLVLLLDLRLDLDRVILLLIGFLRLGIIFRTVLNYMLKINIVFMFGCRVPQIQTINNLRGDRINLITCTPLFPFLFLHRLK